uniref:AIG1-type G domain-containing protein n=1 Tax=Poecilia reticulata TaxID=8081 RepID=A0A3P9Q0C6_POERE
MGMEIFVYYRNTAIDVMLVVIVCFISCSLKGKTKLIALLFHFAATSLNIVLIGTSEAKAKVGNLITRKKSFNSQMFLPAKSCVEDHAKWKDTLLKVVKTPDFFDLHFSSVTKKISKCLGLCIAGPTAILLIVAPSDFTEEKRQTLKSVLKLFGEDAINHAMVILTQTENAIENVSVENIIRNCNQRHHCIPLNKKVDRNSLPNNIFQELMEKIENMLNDGSTQDTRNAVAQEECMSVFSNRFNKTTSVNTWSDDENRNITSQNKDKKTLQHDGSKISNLDSVTMKKENILKTTLKDCNKEDMKKDGERARKIEVESELKTNKDQEKKHAEEKMKLKEQYEKKLADQKLDHLREKMALLSDHNNRMKNLMQKQDEKTTHLTYKYQLELTHQKLNLEVTILDLTKKHNKQIANVVEECQEKITIQKEDHMKETINLKQEYENKLQTLQQESDRTMSMIKAEHDIKTATLNLECQKIQELMKQIEDVLKKLMQDRENSRNQFDFWGIVTQLVQLVFGHLNPFNNLGEDNVKHLKEKLEENFRNEKKEYEEKIQSIKENATKEKMEIKHYYEKKISIMKEKYEKQISSLKHDHNKKVRAQKQQHEKKIWDQKQKHETKIKDLNKQNEERIKLTKQDNKNEIKDLKINHSQEKADLKQEHDENIRNLKEDHEHHVSDMKQEHEQIISAQKHENDEKIKDLMQKCDDKIAAMKQDNEERVKDVKQKHVEDLHSLQLDHNEKMRNLKEENEEHVS